MFICKLTDMLDERVASIVRVWQSELGLLYLEDCYSSACASNNVACFHDINQKENIGIKPVSYTLKTFIYFLFNIINSVYNSVMHEDTKILNLRLKPHERGFSLPCTAPKIFMASAT